MREIKFRAWDKEQGKYINIEKFYIDPYDGADNCESTAEIGEHVVKVKIEIS